MTGTFHHSAANVIELTFSHSDESIRSTDNHPFPSEDRQEFVQAGQLNPGEHVRLRDGSTSQLISTVPVEAELAVFNLEVDGEHVYYVGHNGGLVHNSRYYDRTQWTQKHHPTPRMFLRALDQAGFNVKTSTKTGRLITVRQKLRELLKSEHVGQTGVHKQLDEYFDLIADIRDNEAIRNMKNRRGNGARLAESLREGELTPGELFGILEDTYRMNGSAMADEVRRELL